jgi:hypothetical protein
MGIKWDPISKITNTKRVGGVAQVADHLPSNCKALSSISSTTQHTHTQSYIHIHIYVYIYIYISHIHIYMIYIYIYCSNVTCT